ncbi:MAG: 23S rRNA (guanosine(2251)-2'-O)-methyltransferase RlmB [Thermodesulfobacteriota bacterium]
MAKSNQEKKIFTASDQLLWGVHPVAQQLHRQPGLINEIFIAKREGKKNQEIIDLARAKGVKVKFSGAISIKGEGRINHQGVVARINKTETISENDFLDLLEQEKKPPFLIALDSIQDPHNLGAILRSAAAAGVSGVIVPRDRSAPLGGTAAKVAAGAMAMLNICQVTNLSAFLQKIQEKGVWVFGTVKDEGQAIFESDLSGSICLVIGNEEKGIRPLIAKQCDVRLTIPMPGQFESLNASVAAGIALFEVVRQRRLP